MLLKICSKLLCLKEKKIMRTYGTHLKEEKKIVTIAQKN